MSAADVDTLFDYAVERPVGFTRYDVADDLGWTKDRFTKAVNATRRTLGHDDMINLVCDPQGQHEAWLYRLVGTPAESSVWIANRVGDTEARLHTMKDVSRSMERASDGRTIAGRKARKMARSFEYLIQELADIDADMSEG